MEEKYEQARTLFENLQKAGVVDVDDYGNISPSKQKPDAEFKDFENN